MDTSTVEHEAFLPICVTALSEGRLPATPPAQMEAVTIEGVPHRIPVDKRRNILNHEIFCDGTARVGDAWFKELSEALEKCETTYFIVRLDMHDIRGVPNEIFLFVNTTDWTFKVIHIDLHGGDLFKELNGLMVRDFCALFMPAVKAGYIAGQMAQ